MQLHVRATWIIALLSFTGITALAEEGEISKIEKPSPIFYIVGVHGYLEKWVEFKRVEHFQLPGISRRLNSCQQAVLSPNGEKLAISVSTTYCPLRVVETKDMCEIDLSSISFPDLPSRVGIHEPLGLYMPTNGFVMMTDEAYTTCKTAFSDMLINLNTKEVFPLGPIQLPVTRLGQFGISPGCSTAIYAVTSKALRVFDLGSRSVTARAEFSLDGWSQLHEITFDWPAKHGGVVLTNHVEDAAETLRLDIDLDTLEVTKVKSPDRWSEYDVAKSSALGQLVRTYDRGYSPVIRKHHSLPLLDTRLRLALAHLTEEKVQKLPFKSDSMFLSPDGRFMACSRMYSEAIDNTGFTRFLGEWVLVDLHSGKSLLREHYPEEITSITFAPQG